MNLKVVFGRAIIRPNDVEGQGDGEVSFKPKMVVSKVRKAFDIISLLGSSTFSMDTKTGEVFLVKKTRNSSKRAS